ncbi:MAG: HD-GYP domain-containing protein [Armatimonadota bacterium]
MKQNPPKPGSRDKRAEYKLRIGSRLLKDAYSGDGQLLLKKGAIIETLSMVHRLSQHDVRFGNDRSTQIPLDLKNERMIDNMPNPEAVEFAQKVEKATRIKNEAVEEIKSIYQLAEQDKPIDIKVAQRIVASLLESLLEDSRALVSLVELKNVDEYSYTHCVNVGILAMHLAIHTDLRNDIEELGLGALLHDVGKAAIPTSILNKPGPLTIQEMQKMKRHPIIGYERIKKSGETRHIVLECVLYHHETMNGKGYPKGIKSHNLPQPARITAIADKYDALTTDRPYRQALNPKDALSLMTGQMSKELDETLLQNFVSIIGYYPVGSYVELSNGFHARVINHYTTNPHKPKVILMADDRGEILLHQPVIELSKEHNTRVVRFLDNQELSILHDSFPKPARNAA